MSSSSAMARPSCLEHTTVITGAGGGIGRELAGLLARVGTPLALVDNNPERLEAVASQCEAFGARVMAFKVDVADSAAVEELASAVAHEMGPAHALYNLAGVIHAGTLVDSHMAEIEEVIRVDLLGSIATSKAFLPQLARCGHGQLVNVSSAFGLIGVAGYTAYNAAKFGIRGFTEALQQEARDVQVAMVYPGGVRTDIMRHGRYAPSVNATEIERRFDQSIARTSAPAAAAIILRQVDRGKRRIVVGPDARLVDVLTRVAGTGYQRFTRRMGITN